MAAQAAVWGRCRLGLGTRHAGLELAHGEVLPGLGRYHRVLDVLEVVGLDRPVRSRAGGDALLCVYVSTYPARRPPLAARAATG